MLVTIVAFRDNYPNSVAYQKFFSLEKALEFYKKQLEDSEVRVISTRKVEVEVSDKIGDAEK